MWQTAHIALTDVGAAEVRHLQDVPREGVMSFNTTEEEHVTQSARPGLNRQPTWQLDRSATATWRSNPSNAQHQQGEASATPSCKELGLHAPASGP